MVRNKKIEEAKKELLSLSQDEGNQRIADFRERELRDKIDMYETGKDIGKAEGIKEGKVEVIINLLNMKMPIDKIMQATKIPKEEIEKIRKSKLL